MPLPFFGGETDYQKTIDRIIELERTKLTRIESTVSAEELKLNSLRDVRGNVSALNDILRQLAGINSAFKDVKGVSSAPQAVEAFVNTNDRRVKLGNYQLEVKKVASQHTIASHPIITSATQPALTLPKGNITFLLRNEPYDFAFAGGNISNFTSALTADTTLAAAMDATVLKRSSDQQVIVLRAKNSGKANTIRIKKDNDRIMRQLGLFKSNPPIYAPFIPPATFTTLYKEKDFIRSVENGYDVIAIPPKNELKLTYEKILDFATAKNLSFYFKIAPAAPPTAPTPPATQQTPSPPPQLIATLTYKHNSTTRQARIKTSDVFFNITLIDAYALSILDAKAITLTELVLTNTSENDTFLYGIPQLEVKRPSADPFIPTKTLQAATDATLIYQGLDITRPANVIDDLVPGVTFKLKQQSKEPVTITLEQDDESILTGITEWASAYNSLLEVINIYLSPNEDSLGAGELNELYQERVGVLRENGNLARLKRSLRARLTQPYPNASTDLLFLSQIGFEYVFTAQSVYNINSDKIDFNATRFTDALATYGTSVYNLFSYDTNKDNLPDTGILIELERLLDRYLDRRGFLALQESNYSNNLTRLRSEATREEERLSQRRTDLEEDFSEVEALQNSQESVRAWLESLQNN